MTKTIDLAVCAIFPAIIFDLIFLFRAGIKTDDCGPLSHLLNHKIFVSRHCGRLLCDLISTLSRYDNYAIIIADDHITGENRHVTTTDGAVDFNRFVTGQVRRGRRTLIIGGHVESSNVHHIAKSPIRLAQGIIIEAQFQGLQIPSDIAVIGFGDQEFSKEIEPPLTTVQIDRDALGQTAAQLLLQRLAGDAIDHTTVDPGFQIIRRRSAQVSPFFKPLVFCDELTTQRKSICCLTHGNMIKKLILLFTSILAVWCVKPLSAILKYRSILRFSKRVFLPAN